MSTATTVGMAATTTKLQDLAFKLRYFSQLHDTVDRAVRGDKVKGSEDLLKVLENTGMSNMVSDRFTAALEPYSMELREPLADFVKCYKAFKTWADAQRTRTRNVVLREDVYSTLDVVTKAYDAYQTFQNNNTGIHTRQPPPASQSRHDFPRGYGEPSSREPKYGETALNTLTNLQRRVDNLVKDSDLPNRDGVMTQNNALRDNINKLQAALNERDTPISNPPVYVFFDSTKNMVDELQKVLDAYDDGSVAERFDVKKSSPDDFLGYQDRHPIWLPEAAKMQRIDPFKSLVSISRLYDRMGQPLLGAIEDGIKVLTGLVKSAALDTKDDSRKRDLQTMLDLLIDLSSQLVLAPMSGKKAKQLDEFSGMMETKASLLRAGDKIVLKQRYDSKTQSSSSSSYSTMSGSSSMAPLSDGPGSSAAGFMYRRLDKQRLNAYLTQLDSFKKALEGERLLDHLSNLSERLGNRTTELEAQLLAASKDADPTRADYLKRTLSEAKKRALLTFCRSARRTIGGYVAMHIGFLMKKHRDAVDYINYWHAMADAGIVTDEDAIKDIKSYQDLRKEIVAMSKAKLMEEAAAKVRSALEVSASTKAVGANIGLTEVQATEVDEAFTRLLVWIGNQADRVSDMYAKGRPSLVESLLDPQFITLYVLKALRVLIAWFALRVAGRVFQNMYDDRVYSRDEQPPEPIIFLGMVLGIDIALNVVIVAVLIFAKHLFKTVDNEFPIDRHLLTLWGVDYLLSSVVVGAVAYIIGQVIKRKKYFRYKYEGDRGVRAMQQMTMYIYGIMLFVPFFRLANG